MNLAKQTTGALLLFVALICNVQAAPTHVYGWVEMARLHPWDVQAKAKLDSGALTSSLHAEDIRHFTRDDQQWVRFTLELEDERTGKMFRKTLEKPVYRTVRIRGAGGSERRPVVIMKICLGNIVYEDQFNLEDRGDMIYPILLGRRTIQHMGVIDVTRTFVNDPACDGPPRVSRMEDREVDEDIGI